MKKLIVLLVFSVSILMVNAQDTIRTREGRIFTCKIISADRDFIYYSIPPATDIKQIPSWKVSTYSNSIAQVNITNVQVINPMTPGKHLAVAGKSYNNALIFAAVSSLVGIAGMFAPTVEGLYIAGVIAGGLSIGSLACMISGNIHVMKAGQMLDADSQ